MDTPAVQPIEVTLRGRPARAFAGGSGSPLVLIHGGWAGARMHWSRVWDRLAERHRVIAPELPGLGAVEQDGLPDLRSYAEWLEALCDALGLGPAWLVGNSFGGSVAWALAGRFPARCAGLVLVDGFPMPRTPPLLQLAGRAPGARWLLEQLIWRIAYHRKQFARAFADPSRAPPELAQASATGWSRMVPRYAAILLAGDECPAPRLRPHLFWGADDRLPGTSRRDAEKLREKLGAASLRFFEHAGHFPQTEAPEEFAGALEELIGAPQGAFEPAP